MNRDNFLILQENLRYLGFGEVVASNEQIEMEMEKGTSAFQLKTAACFDEWSTIQAAIYFERSGHSDTYYFNKYDVVLMYDSDPKRNRMQTFYIRKGRGVTFKEAFNLLQGRAVYKNLIDQDGQEYNTWIQLSFFERTPDNTNYRIRQFGEKHGYDLEKVLSAYPIRELEDEKLKVNLLYSLQKGNIHPVTFVKANKTERMYVAACPESRSLRIFSEAIRAVQRFPGNY